MRFALDKSVEPRAPLPELRHPIILRLVVTIIFAALLHRRIDDFVAELSDIDGTVVAGNAFGVEALKKLGVGVGVFTEIIFRVDIDGIERQTQARSLCPESSVALCRTSAGPGSRHRHRNARR